MKLCVRYTIGNKTNLFMLILLLSYMFTYAFKLLPHTLLVRTEVRVTQQKKATNKRLGFGQGNVDFINA